MSFLVFVVTVLVLVQVRNQGDSSWAPSGSDWDQWYASALYWSRDVPYPSTRWPLYGLLTALLNSLTWGHLHITAALVSMGATGLGAGAGTWLGWRLLGPVPAVVAATLLVGQQAVVAHANWIGPYALWAAAAVTVVAALVEGTLPTVSTRPQPGPWVVAGLGIGSLMALVEKGMVLAFALLPLAVLALLVHRRHLARHAAAFVAPIACLALIYRLLPMEFVSLDYMMLLPQMRGSLPDQVQAAMEGSGYIFGRHMAPDTLLQTIRLGMRLTKPDASYLHDALYKIQASYPHADASALWIAAIGWASGVIAAGRRLWKDRDPSALLGWLGVAAVVAAVAPALNTEFNIRFILPGLFVAPLAFLGAFSLLPRRVGPLALLVLPLVFLEASPWKHSAWSWTPTVINWRSETDALQAHIWFDVRKLAPGQPVDLIAPVRGGILLMESNPGKVFGGGPGMAVEAMPNHYVVAPVDGVTDPGPYIGKTAASLPGFPDDPRVSTRTVLHAWAGSAQTNGGSVFLGPVP